MTRNEMHTAIAIKLQKINSFAYDNFQPEELDFILNDAQLRLIKQRTNLRSDPKQEGFVKNQKRLNDIQPLITTYSKDLTTNEIPAAGIEYSFALPAGFFEEVETRAVFRISDPSPAIANVSRLIPVRVIENDRFWEDMQNPFRKPLTTSLPGYISSNLLTIKPKEKYILIGIRLNYIRIPQKISATLSCELPEHIHSEIVDLAVTQLLEILESKRYQSSKIEASQSE